MIIFKIKDANTGKYYCIDDTWWCEEEKDGFSFSSENQAKTMIMMSLDGNYNRYKIINCSNVSVKITLGEFLDELEEFRDEYEDYSVDAVGSLSSPDEQYFTVRVSCGDKEKRIEIPTLRS